MRNRPLSVEDFKSWLSKDLSEFFVGREEIKPADDGERFIGRMVRSKVSVKKLLEKAEGEGDLEELSHDFFDNGGTILAVEDKRVFIEVGCGEFYVPRFCVKVMKQD